MDLKLARLLAGVGGPRARSEVSALVSSMAEAGHGLPHPADRLAVVIEASQVLGRPMGIGGMSAAWCIGRSAVDLPAFADIAASTLL